ncbi:MAG: HAMP domain-containing histidine kinase [Burkholderiales bacterium]|nr:HAMP domain-containing histidine kinase [Burkholderiales bacterium]
MSDPAAQRPLLRRVLMANLLLALLLYAALVAAALLTLTQAAERAARTDIAAELRVLARHAEALKVVAFADEIEYRTQLEADDALAQSLYLLLRRDGSKLVGNLERWPDGSPAAAGRLRFDAAQAGVPAGRAVAEAALLEGDFLLLVGRRLEPVDAMLREFLPAALLGLAGFVALASMLTLRTARQFRQRIAATNAVFDGLRRGDLKQRVSPDIVEGGDELAQLATNVNRALAEMERLVKGLDAFSQTAAHELNRELSHLRDEARASGASRFVEATERLIELLRQILTLARIEAGPGFENRALDASALVAAAAEVYRDAAQLGGVDLVVDTSGAAGATIHGVEELLRSALMNLIENALKHSPPGAAVKVAVQAEAHAVTIAVRDQGPGAASDDLTQLIAAGSQGPAPGHGFGLRLVQAVAIRHGARILLQNTRPGFEVTMRFSRSGSAQ